MTTVALPLVEHAPLLGYDSMGEGAFPGTPTFKSEVDLGYTLARSLTAPVSPPCAATPLIGHRLLRVVMALQERLQLFGPPRLSGYEGITWLEDAAESEPLRRSSVPAAEVLGCVDRCAAWLNCTEEEVAAYAGFSRRSIANWRRGVDPYPSTVRGLLELHALLSLLSRTQGEQRLRYLAESAPGAERSRREDLQSPEGRRRLLAELSDHGYVHLDREVIPTESEMLALEGRMTGLRGKGMTPETVRRVRRRPRP